MWGFLKELNEAGTTIILTTHYLEEAEQLCRNIAIIDRGEIVENTSIQALLSKLDRETFVFDLKQPVTSLPALEGVQFNLVGSQSIEAEIKKDISINRLFDLFNQQNIEVLSMRNKSNRLEELFISLIENGSH